MKGLVLIFMLVLTLFATTQEEVAKRSYEVISGYESSISKTTMILRNANGDENIRKMEFSKLENKNGDKSLINFLYPNDIKDTKLLSFEVIGGDDKQWLYLPALKRVKRISSRNKSGSFMASEFSYEDISSQNYKNYSYRGEAKIINKNNHEYYEVIRVPIDENSGYSKQIIYIDTKEFLPKIGEYYDKQNRLLKNVSFLEYKKIDGIYRIVKIVIENIQNNKTSVLIWDQDNIKQGLSEDNFTQRELK